MTQPLTPANCDLRGLPFMPLDVVRLRESDLAALTTGDEFKACVLLWCAAWNQVPAASLPDEDRVLCRLAGLSLSEWREVKAGAMRGWQLCDDGRLYHPVVAEKALEAWAARGRQRERAMKRWAKKPAENAETHEKNEPGNAAELPPQCHGISTELQGTGTGTGIYKKEANASSVVSAETKPTEADRSEEQGLLAELELGPKPKPSPWLKDAAFCAAWKSCTPEMRKRSKDRDKTWPIWARAAVRAGGPDVLLAALQAYVAGDKDIGRTGGPGFHLWLSEGKWEHWLASQQASPGSPKAPWVGPSDLRAAAVAQKDEGWAQAYIDPSGWRDLPTPALIPRNGFAAKIIREEIGHILRQMGVEIEEKAA